jgi:hypothetical protein
MRQYWDEIKDSIRDTLNNNIADFDSGFDLI